MKILSKVKVDESKELIINLNEKSLINTFYYKSFKNYMKNFVGKYVNKEQGSSSGKDRTWKIHFEKIDDKL
jgi:hypothetical protein